VRERERGGGKVSVLTLDVLKMDSHQFKSLFIRRAGEITPSVTISELKREVNEISLPIINVKLFTIPRIVSKGAFPHSRLNITRTCTLINRFSFK
jgi:hypothetical protein